MAVSGNHADRGGREAKLRFLDALAGLEPMRREVLILHAADGLELAVIAHRLGIGVDEVVRLFAAALVEVDRALDDGGEGA